MLRYEESIRNSIFLYYCRHNKSFFTPKFDVPIGKDIQFSKKNKKIKKTKSSKKKSSKNLKTKKHIMA